MHHERRLVLLGDEVVDAYVGYRSWLAIFDAGKPRILSPQWRSNDWKPGRTVTSKCSCYEAAARRGGGFQRHTCGIYAYQRLGDMLEDPIAARPRSIYGEVALWGDVQIHELGYRGEHAKIISFLKMADSDLSADSCALHMDVPLVACHFAHPRLRDVTGLFDRTVRSGKLYVSQVT